MNHYVYYSYEDWGRGYIGVRQCECNVYEDEYLGSYYDKTFNPKSKIILMELVSEFVEVNIPVVDEYNRTELALMLMETLDIIAR